MIFYREQPRLPGVSWTTTDIAPATLRQRIHRYAWSVDPTDKTEDPAWVEWALRVTDQQRRRLRRGWAQ